MKYLFDKYWSLNFNAIGNYKTLLDYLQDEEALRVFSNKFGYRLDEAGELKLIPNGDPSREHWHYYINDNLKANIELMNNQLVVYMATIIEACIGEFFLCAFIKSPDRIQAHLKEYREINSDLGLSVRDILKFNNKEEFVIEYANRAANLFNSGKILDIIKRIKVVSGLEFESTLKETVIEIVRIRNEIVHANKHQDIDYQKLQLYSTCIDNLLTTLALKLNEMGIEVNDPGNLLHLREEIYELEIELEELEVISGLDDAK